MKRVLPSFIPLLVTVLVGWSLTLTSEANGADNQACLRNCESLFGKDSVNRFRQQADQSLLNQCLNVAARSTYVSCIQDAEQEQTKCRTACQWYLEGPCYGECQDNYQKCLGECVTNHTTAANDCVRTLLDACYPACVDKCSEGCIDEAASLAAARHKVKIACAGVPYPLRLLTDGGGLPLTDCGIKQRARDEAKAKLEQAEKGLAGKKSERGFIASVLDNQESELVSLEKQLTDLRTDAQNKRIKMREAEEKLNEIKSEADDAWMAAIGGTAGPLGLPIHIFFWIKNLVQDKDKTHASARIGVSLIHELTEFAPVEWVGVAYDGVELERLKTETKEAEKNFNQKLDWYRSALTLLRVFEKRFDTAALKKKIQDNHEKLKVLDGEIPLLEEQMPALKTAAEQAEAAYNQCVKDKQKEDQTLGQEGKCREALLEERTAQKAYDACMETKK